MRVARRHNGDHAVFVRTVTDKSLLARRGLINLPLPLPSIPVLTPLLSPIISGNNQNSGGSSSPPAAPPSPSTPSSGGSTGGTSGGSSGGTSGGSSSGSGSGSGSGTSSGSTGSSSGGSTGATTGGTSAGSSSGSSSSGGSSTGSASSGSSSGASNSSPVSVGTSATTSSSQPLSGAAGAALSDTSSGATGGSITATTGTSGGNNGNTGASYGSSAGGGGVVNAGNTTAGQTGGSGHSATGGSSSTTGGSTTSSGGTVDDGSGSSGGDSKNPSNASGKGGLSGGSIAAVIIVVVLLALGVVVFVVRKRSRNRRQDRANKWWFTGRRNSREYGDNRHSAEILTPGRASHRSSFATTVDHSDVPAHLVGAVPAMPPSMVEIGRTRGTDPNLVLDLTSAQARFSIGSANSDNSQYLIVHHRDSVDQNPTPTSASIGQPTESFSFPKPPSVSDRTSIHSKFSGPSRPTSVYSKTGVSTPSAYSSNATLACLKDDGTFTASGPDVPPTPALPPGLLKTPPPSSPISSDPFADNNPFEDPAVAAVSLPELKEVELVRRPFVPQLQDELQVSIGDSVRIIKTFDDGWGLVEKFQPSDKKGKAKEIAVERGLVPIDCLREPGQSLPSFFSKRLSSHAEEPAQAV